MIHELRIGNLVYDDRNCETVIFSLDTEINHDDLWQKYTGVPLNEDWLLRFGFEQTDKRRKWIFTLKSKGFKFFINCNGSFCIVKGTGMRVENMNVHNLQNLYFALTNEELTLK